MNIAGAGRQTAAAFAATTEMIIMRADDDVFVFEHRIGPFEHTDHVVSGNFVANYVDRKAYRSGERFTIKR